MPKSDTLRGDRKIETLNGVNIYVGETANGLFSKLELSSPIHGVGFIGEARLTDEEVVLLRDTLTQLLRTRRRRK